jgi:hypothetical protein
LRRVNPVTLLAFAGVAVTIGGTIAAIAAAQAQISAVHSAQPAGLFDYWGFNLGFAVVAFGAIWGVLAVSSIGSQSRERRETPFEFQIDYGVYSHEWRQDKTRRFRIRVVNHNPVGLVDVRVRILGGRHVKTAGYLREYDDAPPYADSRSGVAIPGGQQRYFLLAEMADGAKEFELGFINQELVKDHPLPWPSMVDGEESYIYLMVDGRSAKDGSFVRSEYATVRVVEYHDVPGLRPLPPPPRFYDAPLSDADRQRLP